MGDDEHYVYYTVIVSGRRVLVIAFQFLLSSNSEERRDFPSSAWFETKNADVDVLKGAMFSIFSITQCFSAETLRENFRQLSKTFECKRVRSMRVWRDLK